MTGIFGRLFGKKSNKDTDTPAGVIENTFSELIRTAGLDLEFSVEDEGEGSFKVEVFGQDEELLVSREGQLLDAFQLFVTRVCQHRFADSRVNISVDNSGYREEVKKELIDLAQKLKDIAVEKGKPVYFRALPPRDRKLVHQYLAEDSRVKSRSVGEGLFKKIKIFPTNRSDSDLSTEA